MCGRGRRAVPPVDRGGIGRRRAGSAGVHEGGDQHVGGAGGRRERIALDAADRRALGSQRRGGDGHRRTGGERDRPEEALGLAVDAGAEVKRARRAARAAVAEAEAPLPALLIVPLGVLSVPASVPGVPGVVGRVMAMIVPLGAVPVASPKLPTRRSPPNEPKPAGAMAIPQGPLRLVPAVSV